MLRLSIIYDAIVPTVDLPKALVRLFDVSYVPLSDIKRHAPTPYLVLDINLRNPARLAKLKGWLQARPKGGCAIFVVDKASRREKIQAYAMGATNIIHRPIGNKEFLRLLLGDFNQLGAERPESTIRSLPAIGSSFSALEDVFSSASLGDSIDLARVHTAGEQLVDRIEAIGLGSWVSDVRKHHSLTYQHSLIVTGVAVAFGQNLGFSKRDRQKLSLAGMLHDIGKARIPTSILEKPGPLNSAETAIMRKHPQYGHEALKSVPEVQDGILDMVLHHHEYLDGSGYPHGIQGNAISDLVRIITISDIFGALIERRSYREPMSGADAYRILEGMGPKLDRELVGAFRPTSNFRFIPSQDMNRPRQLSSC